MTVVPVVDVESASPVRYRFSTDPKDGKDMINLLKPSMLAFVLVLHACNYVPSTSGTPGTTKPSKPTPTQAAEVDPGLALGGLTLLAGALTVLRVRRQK